MQNTCTHAQNSKIEQAKSAARRMGIFRHSFWSDIYHLFELLHRRSGFLAKRDKARTGNTGMCLSKQKWLKVLRIQWHCKPNKNFAFGNLRILSVFSKFDGGQNFFENVVKKEHLRELPWLWELCFYPQSRKSQKNVFSLLAIFDKNTGHRVTKFYPVSCSNITYNFYFMIFSLARKFFLSLFISTILSLSTKESGIE